MNEKINRCVAIQLLTFHEDFIEKLKFDVFRQRMWEWLLEKCKKMPIYDPILLKLRIIELISKINELISKIIDEMLNIAR